MQSFGEQRQEYEAENVTRSLDPVSSLREVL